MIYHQPVLLQETIDLLSPSPDKVFIDCTLGHGGHTIELLKCGATVFGIDQDPSNLAIASDRIRELNLSKNFTPINENFSELTSVYKKYIHHQVNGILFDLGLSQNQQTATDRGFSFNDTLSLDMRLSPVTQSQTAENFINTASPEELYSAFSKIAQEQYSQPLVDEIIHHRQKQSIKTGQQLANIIRDFYQKKHVKTAIDPATKIFLALRVLVNDEFANLKSVLSQTLEIVSPKGTVCVISFHSGEDRIVKQFIQKYHLSKTKLIIPSSEEIRLNSLSRSARLRSYTIV
ncbi:MAG: 16S rRNA (cytosine(1402)-N(4))-methyltransferase RsmH [Candidatus Shapirobacteria bacterium]